MDSVMRAGTGWPLALARAVEVLGGDEDLAAVLYTTPNQVRCWKEGQRPPRGILLALAEINLSGQFGRLAGHSPS